MIIKLDSGRSRLDKDVEIAIKNRGLREEMKGWASTTQLDRDVEVAVKNRGLKENMNVWREDKVGKGGNFFVKIIKLIPDSARPYMRAAAVFIGIMVLTVPSLYIPYPYEGANQYIASSSYCASLTRGGGIEDILSEAEDALKSGDYCLAIAKANEVQYQIEALSSENRNDFSIQEMKQHAEWYETLGYLAKGRVKDRIYAHILLKNIVKDKNHAHYSEALEILQN